MFRIGIRTQNDYLIQLVKYFEKLTNLCTFFCFIKANSRAGTIETRNLLVVERSLGQDPIPHGICVQTLTGSGLVIFGWTASAKTERLGVQNSGI